MFPLRFRTLILASAVALCATVTAAHAQQADASKGAAKPDAVKAAADETLERGRYIVEDLAGRVNIIEEGSSLPSRPGTTMALQGKGLGKQEPVVRRDLTDQHQARMLGDQQHPLYIRRRLQAAAYALFGYAFVGGLIVSPADFFPASVFS